MIPDTTVTEITKKQIEKLQANLDKALKKERALAEENDELKAHVATLKEQNRTQVEKQDFRPEEATEAETRKVLIDLLLIEAGWNFDKDISLEYEVHGMPNKEGVGYVDYVLWGDDGKPLAVVEAKRSTKSPTEGQHQAKLYADCLEQEKGQRPFIFYTNGYETYFWDDQNYPPRTVQGFYTKEELLRLINRRSTREKLLTQSVNTDIVERYYQKQAIKRICEEFEKRSRKSLLVMATGSGKTRTAIALVDLLMKANWVKRTLFLADRNALVSQAKRNFTKFLPNVSTIDLTKEKEAEGTRIVFSTYPTIMNVIDQKSGDERLFSVGHFDLIIIDEAHRSIYQKYRAIFEYFDSLLIGLTATPKDEVDRNTYQMFELESGIPTYAYELDQAVDDGFLVPYKAISVPIKFQQQGIKYDELQEEEKLEYEEKFYDDEADTLPAWIESSKLNSWVFNEDTVDKVLTFLMEHGQKVQGGDKLGKTIIFAKNHKHAEFIEKRFNKLFPKHRGNFLNVIDNQVKYAHDRIEQFEKKNDNPVIALSVDMLDTGIDVPEILNLVFFKIVRSKSKFWQMIGRGTRLCKDLFAPAEHKEFFTIFDFCENFEFFSENPEGYAPPTQESLAERIFKRRLQLSQKLCSGEYVEDEQHENYRKSLLDLLHRETVGMGETRGGTLLVRPHRKYIDTFSARDRWEDLSTIDIDNIERHIAHLSLPDTEDELARRFDLLILNLQLAFIEKLPQQQRYISYVQGISRYLHEKKMNVPAVAKQIRIMQEILTDKFWEEVTVVQLERVRVALRDLIKFMDKKERNSVYTDFEDEILDEREAPDISGGMIDITNYKRKLERYVRENQDHITIHKLRFNEPVTGLDVAELEKMLFSGKFGSKNDFQKAYGDQQELGSFIRRIVGLDRQAAKQAFSGFISEHTLSSEQMEFINQIIDFLTQTGSIQAEQLFDVPFTDIHYEGVTGVFPFPVAEKIKLIIDRINENADVSA